MENVIMITFDVEAQAYQAFSQLKNDSVNSAYTILQMAVIKNEDGKIVPVDGFDSGIDSSDDTWTGGLIGSVVGILGGPLGEGKTAIVALVQENDEKAFDLRLADYQCTITRWDAGEIADEVEQAEQEQKQLAKEAREKLRAQKKADREKERAEKRAAIHQKFEDFKARL